MRTLSFCIAFCAAFPSTSPAQCPLPSTSFGPAGLSEPATDFLVFDDGSGPALYACGAFTAAGNAVAHGVARLDASGWHGVGEGIDFATYENGAIVPTITFSYAPSLLAALDDGNGSHLYAAGSVSLPTLPASGLPQYVARWDGAHWSTIPGGPPPDDPTQEFRIAALATFDSGGGPWLYAGGWTYTIEGNRVPYLARWDGATWTRITSGPSDPACDPWLVPQCTGSTDIRAMTVFDDGSGPALWVGGSFRHVGGAAGFTLAKFDGTTWSAPLGTSYQDTITKLVVHDDGSSSTLYVGSATGLRYWTGSGLGGAGFSVPILDLDSASPAQAGSLAGLWTVVQTPQHFVTAWRFDGAAWTQTSGILEFNAGVDRCAAYDDGTGAALYVGGPFHKVDGIPATFMARHDANGWSAVGSGLGFSGRSVLTGRVSAIEVWNAGNGDVLYAGGELGWVNGAEVFGLVRWNGSGWTLVPGWYSDSTSLTRLLAADVGQGPELWVAGSLQFLQGGYNPLLRITANGTTLGFPNPGGPRCFDLAVFDAGAGPKMYATFGLNVMRWDGAQLQTIGTANSAGSGTVNALCTFDDGTGPKLYAGGQFTSISGVPAAGFARFDGQSWSAVSAGISATGDGIQVMRVLDLGAGPKLYAGGAFTSAGNTTVSNLAVFDGQSWTSVGGGVAGPIPHVLSIEAFDDGRGDGKVLYVGGTFTSAGGVQANNLARFDGTTWTDVGSTGGLPAVRTLRAIDMPSLGGRALAVGGSFDSIARTPSARFGVLRACDEIGRTFCFGDVGACPCGNTSPAGSHEGCLNSFGTGAALHASGTPSVAADSLVLNVTGMSPTQHSPTYFQGTVATNGGLGAPFGDGLRCASGAQVRIGTIPSSGGVSAFGSTVPGTGSVAARGGITTPGVVRHYQVLYRNAQSFCTSASLNLSNGVSIQWGP